MEEADLLLIPRYLSENSFPFFSSFFSSLMQLFPTLLLLSPPLFYIFGARALLLSRPVVRLLHPFGDLSVLTRTSCTRKMREEGSHLYLSPQITEAREGEEMRL